MRSSLDDLQLQEFYKLKLSTIVFAGTDPRPGHTVGLVLQLSYTSNSPIEPNVHQIDLLIVYKKKIFKLQYVVPVSCKVSSWMLSPFMECGLTHYNVGLELSIAAALSSQPSGVQATSCHFEILLNILW